MSKFRKQLQKTLDALNRSDFKSSQKHLSCIIESLIVESNAVRPMDSKFTATKQEVPILEDFENTLRSVQAVLAREVGNRESNTVFAFTIWLIMHGFEFNVRDADELFLFVKSQFTFKSMEQGLDRIQMPAEQVVLKLVTYAVELHDRRESNQDIIRKLCKSLKTN